MGHSPHPNRIGDLRSSARGWHRAQLAVLGFIGLCGVLQRNPTSGIPDWLETLAGILVLAALGIACLATVLVALAAWPVYAADVGTEDENGDVARTSRRLRLGITLTYVSVAVLALGTSTAWWPGGASGSDQNVVVVTRAGQVCGGLQTPSGTGVLAVSVGGRTVQLALADIVSLKPVDTC